MTLGEHLLWHRGSTCYDIGEHLLWHMGSTCYGIGEHLLWHWGALVMTLGSTCYDMRSSLLCHWERPGGRGIHSIKGMISSYQTPHPT